MLGYGLAGDVEVFCNGVGRHCLHSDEDKDRSSGRVCNCLENVASHKFQLRSRSVANIRATDWLRKIFF